MSHESHEPNERLSRATTAFRDSAVTREASDRGEDAVLNRVTVKAKPTRRGWLLAAGLGTLVVAAVLTTLPRESYAAELKRIGQNGDKALHHLLQYEVSKEGTPKLVLESYAAEGRSKVIYSNGVQTLFQDGRYTTVYVNGATVKQTARHLESALKPVSAKDILAKNATGPGVKVKVQRGVVWQNLKVDRYTVDRTIVDGRGDTLQLHMTLIAEPATERPLEMQADLTGFPRSVLKWDYPAPDTTYLELPIPDKNRVYDVEAERQTVLSGLQRQGHKVVLAGQTVELLQLWVGEDGEACAIARAEYAYPCNYGIKIDGIDLAGGPDADTKSKLYYASKPTVFDGRSVQLFYTYRPPDAGRVEYPDIVTVRVPVFTGSEFAGYATFEGVPVFRAWSLRMLLEPMNAPFWMEPPTEGAPAAKTR